MNLLLKIFVLLAMISLLNSETVYSDTVLLRNGDKLIGDIQNKHFIVQGSLGRILVKKAFCKNIIMDDNRDLAGSLKTINNDYINGTILNKQIKILFAGQNPEAVNLIDLKSLFVELSSPSHQVVTTIFTTVTGDRFSGRMLTPEISVRTLYMTAKYKRAEINRIEFDADKPGEASVLLSNGELIHGSLLLDEIMIEPDSFAQMGVDQSELRSIQFNARKMLLKEYSGNTAPAKDSDGDGVPDDADACHNTPRGDLVDENGCSTDKITAKNFDEPEPAKLITQDQDDDSVLDDMDQCPQTPLGAKVDKNGCWLIQDILFDFDSDRLKSEYYPILNEVLAVLQKDLSVKIEIQGGADNIGSEDYNIALSQRRAQNAKNYLTGKGIELDRITAVGYGTAGNKASNENPAGRALNRRIDFRVIE